MAESHTLPALSPREAVIDALHRCVLGLDSNDRALFESACVKDESMTFVAGPDTVQGWSAINERMTRAFSLVTMLVITNTRVELKEGANTAYLTAHAVAYHVPPGDAYKPEDISYTAGCLYFIDLVKDDTDGLWKMKKWVVKIQWTSGDMAIVK